MAASSKDRILLISANRHTDPYPVYPVGVSYLRTYLMDQDPSREVRVIDMNLVDKDELERTIASFDPGHVGISLRNVDDVNITRKEGFIAEYREVFNIVRNQCSACITIGGAGYSIYPKRMFEFLEPDFAVHGEGELTYDLLISRLNAGKDPRGIEGLLYRDGEGNVRKNPKSSFLNRGTPRFMKGIIDYYWKNSGIIGVQTKRGCPFTCNYCTYPLIDGRKVRVFDPDEVVETLSMLKNDHGVEHVFFTDAVFNVQNQKNQQLAEKLIDRGVNIQWSAYFSPANLDKEMLSLFRRSGLSHIEFGTDSLCDAQLERYDKKFDVGQVKRVSDHCRDLDIHHAHFLILDGVGETRDTLEESFENAKKFERTVFFPFVGMRIYPGTPLEGQARREGVIEPEDDLLEPRYYVSRAMELEEMKGRGEKTGKRWVWPDEDYGPVMAKLRSKGFKGPLWEFLIQDE